MNFPTSFPAQVQERHPGIESEMNPRPIFKANGYNVIGEKLKNKIAVITGGDSGIGRAVAYAFSKHGAKVNILYFDEDVDALETKSIIESEGGECNLYKGDIANEQYCISVIDEIGKKYGNIDILVNNSAVQYSKNSIDQIDTDQMLRTFEVNVFANFYLSKASLKYMTSGASIINTSSVTAFHGHKTLIDYSSTKGAITSLTRSLSMNLADKGIRVNAVAPGPIWTPLIPSSFTLEEVSTFGSQTPMKRAGQPVEVAGAYVFLASDEASFITGQTIHINGGEIVNA
ncbi:SDR family oxidoreductase [Clostridium cylindrosporum]|nr:SDR family oxidoreductase [Clostridium cylindrosporum]